MQIEKAYVEFMAAHEFTHLCAGLRSRNPMARRFEAEAKCRKNAGVVIDKQNEARLRIDFFCHVDLPNQQSHCASTSKETIIR
ncbi:MAG TPA: hypothetical protein VFN13_13945 [Rudaea sp.]|nr:hypothetical protein [Rudaea sp.]